MKIDSSHYTSKTQINRAANKVVFRFGQEQTKQYEKDNDPSDLYLLEHIQRQYSRKTLLFDTSRCRRFKITQKMGTSQGNRCEAREFSFSALRWESERELKTTEHSLHHRNFLINFTTQTKHHYHQACNWGIRSRVYHLRRLQRQQTGKCLRRGLVVVVLELVDRHRSNAFGGPYNLPPFQPDLSVVL